MGSWRWQWGLVARSKDGSNGSEINKIPYSLQCVCLLGPEPGNMAGKAARRAAGTQLLCLCRHASPSIRLERSCRVGRVAVAAVNGIDVSHSLLWQLHFKCAKVLLELLHGGRADDGGGHKPPVRAAVAVRGAHSVNGQLCCAGVYEGGCMLGASCFCSEQMGGRAQAMGAGTGQRTSTKGIKSTISVGITGERA